MGSGDRLVVPRSGGRRRGRRRLGAISKATQDAGITKEQLETIRTQITEVTSALFAVTEDADLDRLGERFSGMGSTLVATNLTEAEREVLLETLGG